jgi:hypothetical protein
MQSKLHQSPCSRKGEAAAQSPTFGVDTLENRQFMSISPFIGSVGLASPIRPAGTTTVTVPKAPVLEAGTKTTASLVVSGTTSNTTVRVAARAATSYVAGEHVVVTPTAGNDTASAKRSLWSRVKAAAKWAKDHVVIGLNKIGLKGTF